MPRDKFLRQSVGAELAARVKQARVLLVGAGGIGCELLKNLILTGFGTVHLVDLDTIDLSNLNRQFLFRHEHIKRSKALVAKESAAKFNPNVTIEAHHADIKDAQFSVSWFETFDLVFNALDNLEARRHVNRMCLAAKVPLIESGTTGFQGQVQVIIPGETECYDCNPKTTPKTYPVCTIRSTPSQSIHCIVWAKSYLFAEIFGTSEDDAPDMDTTENSENAKEIETLKQEAQALKRLRESMGTKDFARLVFEKVFIDDINRLRGMEDMWKHRKPPKALDYEALTKEAAEANVSEDISSQDQKVWSVAENFVVFSQSIDRLSHQLEELRAQPDAGQAKPVLSFDKDDKDSLDFVASAANLRAHIFNIEHQSEFEIKQMAGNIIPAIATTNAMTASLCVLQALKVLSQKHDNARMIFLTKSTDRVLTSEKLAPPNPNCPACGNVQARIDVDISQATFTDLVKGILQEQLGYSEEVSITGEAGLLYDADFTDNLEKKLSDLELKQDSFLTVIDEDEEPRVNLVLRIVERAGPAEDDAKPIILPQKPEIARKPKDAAPAGFETNGTSQPSAQTNGVSANGKRKREAEEGDLDADTVRKRGKVVEENGSSATNKDDDVELVIDEADGAIVIDD